MTRFLILLAALLVAAPVPTLRADGFLGLFGKKKQEKVMPAQAELDRREGEARALAAEAAAAAAAGIPAKAAKINLGVAKDYPLSSVAATSLFEAGRLYGEGVGIAHVFVNGAEIVANGALTGEQPGRVLRSGIDTETVPLR